MSYKNKLLLVFLVFIFIILTGCGTDENKKQNSTNNGNKNDSSMQKTLTKNSYIDKNKKAEIENTYEVIRIQKGTAMAQYFIYLKDHSRDNIIKIAKYFQENKSKEHSMGFGLHMYIDKNVNLDSEDYIEKKYAIFNYNKNSKPSKLVIGVKSYKNVYEEIDIDN